METVHILHTNDIHSHLENWPRISQFLQQKRYAYETQKETIFSFDIGDACDRVHPLTEATEGQAITRLLNEGKYDAVTIGNNEGIGSTKAQLNQLYDDARYPVLISNLIDKETGRIPPWAKAFKILHTKEGNKIGIFALTFPLNMSYEPLGWKVMDPMKVTERLIDQFETTVDTFILLSHLGLPYDRKIAEHFPEISVIMGGHTHHVLENGEVHNQTLLTAGGKFGYYVGEITLTFQNHAVVAATAQLHPTAKLEPVYHEKELVRKYIQLGHELLQEQKIAFVPETFQVKWKEPSEFVSLGLKAVKAYAKTDAAILNAGLFVQPLLQGIVTRDELHQALPHPMRTVRCTISGENLPYLMKQLESKRDEMRSLAIKGIGFRGKIFGELCYDGLEWDSNTEEVKVNGKTVLPDETITFVTVDYFIFSKWFPLIEELGEIEILFPFFLRSVVQFYLAEHYPLMKKKGNTHDKSRR
ncbi:bifunctional metallophosphatase/5'-nucleotidase [Lacticigenium naphthae]|uniref:bifunctional metallophosphatase/5'-nucleotidase n=1 Tax=Lacticigenium naphthae TaxID=515351 RepID=UPI0004108881|nr:bifunctional UDP-sugar hydrolase/5'-nucleotidase [Lacticigenium naphthae]